MKLGKVCTVHNEFAPDGQCRWCEPEGIAWVTLPEIPHVEPMNAMEVLRALWIPPRRTAPGTAPNYIGVSHYIACLSFSGAACNCDSIAARFSKGTP